MQLSGRHPRFFWIAVQRLKTRSQFQAVLAGITIAKTEHFVLHRNSLDAQFQNNKAGSPKGQPALGHAVFNTPDSPEIKSAVVKLFPLKATWMGAMVPKRWAKRAVTRNTIKRQIYTVSAGFSDQLPEAVFLVRLRRDFSRKKFVSATSEALKEAVRLELLALMRAGCAFR